MAWHGGGCVYAAVCKYAARRCYDVELMARAHGEYVRRVLDDCSRQLDIRLVIKIFLFAAVVALLLCSFCASKSIAATVCADLSSKV